MMGQVLDSSRSLGMTGGLGWRWGVSAMYWQNWATPPLDPSTLLRMSGPAPRDGFRPPRTGVMEGTLPPRFLAEPRNDRVKRGRRGGGGLIPARGSECKGRSGFGSGIRETLGMPRGRIAHLPDATIVLIVEYAQEIANTGEQDEQSGLTL